MSSYTPGPWRVGPPIFDGDVIFAPPQTEGHRNEVVAMGILNKADARLIAAAPDMLKLLKGTLRYLRASGNRAKGLQGDISALLQKIGEDDLREP